MRGRQQLFFPVDIAIRVRVTTASGPQRIAAVEQDANSVPLSRLRFGHRSNAHSQQLRDGGERQLHRRLLPSAIGLRVDAAVEHGGVAVEQDQRVLGSVEGRRLGGWRAVVVAVVERFEGPIWLMNDELRRQ